MVDRYFAEYASYHTNRRNLLCHEIGIPLIVWSLFSLLFLVKLGPIDLAMIVGVLVIFFYLRLDMKLGLIALVAFTGLYFLGRITPWPVAVGAFIAGWILQFVGHGYEGTKPAFLNNLVHLLVGPLWITSLAIPRARTSVG